MYVGGDHVLPRSKLSKLKSSIALVLYLQPSLDLQKGSHGCSFLGCLSHTVFNTYGTGQGRTVKYEEDRRDRCV